MLQPYPIYRASLVDDEAEAEMQWVMQFILGVRQIKGEMNIAPGKPVPILLADSGEQDRRNAVEHRAFLDFLARIESITVLEPGDAGPESATALIGKMKILIPLSGLIDKDAELARLEKEIGRLRQDVERTEKKPEPGVCRQGTGCRGPEGARQDGTVAGRIAGPCGAGRKIRAL